jgi:hypothetical protein
MLRIFLFGLANRRKQPERYAKLDKHIFKMIDSIKKMTYIIIIMEEK